MVRLYESGSNRLCGTLSDRQFDALVEALEEEELEDGDYAIDRDTLDTLEEQGLEADVLEVLRLALGERPEAMIRCERG
jgi:MoxR-like ATPase